MATAIFWFQRENKALKKEKADADLARIVLLEKQTALCHEDRLVLHRRLDDTQAAHAAEIAELRKSYDIRLTSLNDRITDIYKSRDQKHVAEKLERAADVIKTANGSPLGRDT